MALDQPGHGRKLLTGHARREQRDDVARLALTAHPLLVVGRRDIGRANRNANLAGGALERCEHHRALGAFHDLHEHAKVELVVNDRLADIEHAHLIFSQRGCQHGHQAGLVFARHVHQNYLAGQEFILWSSSDLTLTSWSNSSNQVLICGKSPSQPCLTGARAVVAIWSFTDDREERLERFASSVAKSLAHMSVEPLMNQDRIHLGVLANRVLEISEVVGVGIYTLDNQAVAVSGTIAVGVSHTEPVTLDDHSRLRQAQLRSFGIYRNRKLAATRSLCLPFCFGPPS